MGILDVSHSETGSRGNNPTDKNSIPNNAAADIAKRRGFITPSPLYRPLESGYGQASDGADLPNQK
jgi:hypothetical protein